MADKNDRQYFSEDRDTRGQDVFIVFAVLSDRA